MFAEYKPNEEVVRSRVLDELEGLIEEWSDTLKNESRRKRLFSLERGLSGLKKLNELVEQNSYKAAWSTICSFHPDDHMSIPNFVWDFLEAKGSH